MVNKKPKRVLYRRRREQRTNYNKRLTLLLSRKLRLVLRFTNRKIIAQLIEFNTAGDLVKVGVNSTALLKLGWNYSLKNFPAAYLTGTLLGKTALQEGYKEAVLDTGFLAPLRRSKVYAFLKGATDAGLKIPFGDKEIFPEEKRITGQHIVDYAHALKGKKDMHEQRFTQYLKSGSQPEEMTKAFEQTKKKIIGGSKQ